MVSFPRVVLCTIALNEMEWLPLLYRQHRHWPRRVRWVFVEGADAEYARVNPERVSAAGLSVDGTTEFLEALQSQDATVDHVRFGRSESADPAQGKCAMRTAYLKIAETLRPDLLIVIDADEFYGRDAQERIGATVAGNDSADAFVFRHREIWYPPCRDRERDRLFEQEVVGGFWSIPYCRIWRWRPGLRYESNHNTPEVDGVGLDARLARYDGVEGAPYYCHMAFASSAESRIAKHRYYEERGEKVDRRRKWYCESRRAWVGWKPGSILPRGARVIPYLGEVPECFS